MTVKKYQIDANDSKDKNTQREMIVPQKVPAVINIQKPDGTTGVVQKKAGEETKIYSAPEHYPKKSKHFGHPEDFQRKFNEWMAKSKEPVKGRVVKEKLMSITKYTYTEGLDFTKRRKQIIFKGGK